MLHLQKFLRNNDNPVEKLQQEPYCLKIQEDDPYVIFKYNMIESDFNNPIVCESRGIILENKNWDVVCKSFPKFFNFGETQAYDMNLSNATVYRKYDGSLIKLWYSDHYNKWMISTNGTIDAFSTELIEKSADNHSFGDLVLDVVGGEIGFELLTSRLHPICTYSFELLHPQNIIVEQHTDKRLVLIGVINNESLEDYALTSPSFYEILDVPNIEIAKTFDINTTSYDTILDEASGFNTDNNIFEGFVVADIRDGIVHGRVKVKTPVYLKYHRLTDVKHSDNIFIDVFIENEMAEFETYINQAPTYAKERYFELKEKFIIFVDDIEKTVKDWKSYLKVVKEENPEGYKSEFGRTVQERVQAWKQGFIFEYVYKNINPRSYINRMHRNKLKDILSNYENDN